MTNKLQCKHPSKWIWIVILLTAAALTPPAAAQTFKTLYAFTGGADGGGPWGTPLWSNGLLYETAFYGGLSSSNQAGTVFELDPVSLHGTYLYQFGGQPYDGSAPMGGLITDGAGDFFGTTTQGGFELSGTIYEISQGIETVAFNFSGKNGQDPEGNLLMDAFGNFYGTTSKGGNNDCGTVFAFSAYGTFVPLYSFGNNNTDGIGPSSGVVLQKGILYGVTTEGGQHGWGTIYAVNIKAKTETVLYSFRGGPNGGTPLGALVSDGKGNLYGTTTVGGSANGTAGNGVIFKLNTKTSQYSVVHTFTGADGSQPTAALLPDGQGNFYGTTNIGGAHGFGTVFKLTAAGTLTTLYSFTNGADGSYPYGGLAIDPSGNLYGAATRGGQYGWGTLFEIVP